MTQPAYSVHTSASVIVRPLVLPRAKWSFDAIGGVRGGGDRGPGGPGELAFRPMKGTWYGHVVRGKSAHDVIVLPIIGCPTCNSPLFLAHRADTAKMLSRLMRRPVPVVHKIDHLGKVQPDIQCGGCGFHRKIYLDRWNKTKPLYALAYVDMRKGAERKIEIAYSHSIDTREARFHLGPGKYDVIAGGPAIGFFVDEKTGRVTTD